MSDSDLDDTPALNMPGRNKRTYQAMEWIDAKENPPKTCKPVLVCKHYIDAEFVDGGYAGDREFATPSFITVDKCFSGTWLDGGVVTHWMPLPELPEGRRDNV